MNDKAFWTGQDIHSMDRVSILDDAENLPFNREESRASMVADALAWAVVHRMPLIDALKALPFYRDFSRVAKKWGGLVAGVRDFFLPIRPLFWLPGIRWSWNLGLMIDDLEKGLPLAGALERRLGRHFPAHFLMGLAKAERDNRMELALPALARQLRYPVSITRQYSATVFYVGLKIVMTFWVLSFVAVQVVPKMTEIFRDLLGKQISGEVFDVGFRGFQIVGLLALGIVLYFLLSRNSLIREYVLAWFPLTIWQYRRFAVADLAQSMAVFLRQGEDLVSAAEWSLKSTRSTWMARRIEKFLAALREGRHWVDAWRLAYPGCPMDEWLIRSSATREDPATGFETLAIWTHQELHVGVQRIDRWLDPCCSVLIGAVVAGIGGWVFSHLAQIIVGAAAG
jgi:type II secretory pathway component PulF